MESDAGRILIVYNDLPVMKLITMYLFHQGFTIVGCDSGEEAASGFEYWPMRSVYAVALVEMNLRDLRGDQVARRLLAASPTISVIITCDYPLDLSGFGYGCRLSFLQNPFNAPQLMRAIRARLTPDQDII